MYQGPGIYTHYKGRRYEVLGIGVEESTTRPVVVYRPEEGYMPEIVGTGLPETHFWTRPLEDFNAEVPVGGTERHTETAPRFTFEGEWGRGA